MDMHKFQLVGKKIPNSPTGYPLNVRSTNSFERVDLHDLPMIESSCLTILDLFGKLNVVALGDVDPLPTLEALPRTLLLLEKVVWLRMLLQQPQQ